MNIRHIQAYTNTIQMNTDTGTPDPQSTSLSLRSSVMISSGGLVGNLLRDEVTAWIICFFVGFANVVIPVSVTGLGYMGL